MNLKRFLPLTACFLLSATQLSAQTPPAETPAAKAPCNCNDLEAAQARWEKQHETPPATADAHPAPPPPAKPRKGQVVIPANIHAIIDMPVEQRNDRRNSSQPSHGCRGRQW